MKLALGTVQFGMHYGAFNHAGQPSKEEVKRIFITAKQNDIRTIDTGAAYGCSEEIIGECIESDSRFLVVTKTPVNINDASDIKKSCYDSLQKLGIDHLYGLLVHRPHHLLDGKAEHIYRVLDELKRDGLVKKVGVSVYTPKELESILARFALDLVQIPLNVFDQRFLHRGLLRKLKHIGIEIHVRSIFLQGLLLQDVEKVPKHFSKVRKTMIDYFAFLNSCKLSRLEGAIHFVKQIDEVDRIVVGVDHVQQFIEIIEAYNKNIPRIDFSSFAMEDEDILNPSLWKLEE
ncbi:aryl-alcohol dehydrogenase-like predicted oxidoreductase [Anoxybacillus voinovskiensis]|uniref:Aryl-alcohol dehydrogenase-like predicted oxidoreductase n=1 Tax=Anoxybacteroides voinovskiense TaxID=230470 RepID=A0A840DTV6_9BACL|nr:aldo/keto reductase [Anoxybacillus voinovskiensis]MBB4073747.1 aryl-alcohol dehydrogenase-like predicted oxidoreductase [Anoxybacillus voinovskiensis]GGJ64217.1 oxidoreductase [Anoxybacillus voinovskiensis]